MKKFSLIVLISCLFLTGCVISFKTQRANDLGVFKSENYGQTWVQKVYVGKTQNSVIKIDNVGINQIIFDSLKKDKMYLVTANDGLYYSENNGDLWQKTGLKTGTYVNLVFDPLNSDIMYTAAEGKILKSVDAGKNWKTIYIETQTGQSFTDLAVDYSNGREILAITNNGVLIESKDYGSTWQVSKRFEKYNLQRIFLDPNDPKIMYIISQGKGIFRTLDGGQNWPLITDSFKNFPKSLNIHDFTFFAANPNIFFISTDYGILKTENRGDSFTALSTLLKFGTKIDTVAVDPLNVGVIYFTKDNKLNKTENGGQQWQTIALPTNNLVSELKVYPVIKDDTQTKPGSTLYLGVKPIPKKK